jgi:hypothetical protein
MADPTAVNYTSTSIPDYAKPFVQNMLGQTQALTDINQYPYQSYEGQRVAQWTPMQQQSFQGAETMAPAYQLAGATGIAGLAGNQALNAQYKYNPYESQSITAGNNVQSYMNPYMQNVVDIQKREAQRQSGIQGTQQQAQAAQAGAFGGGRDAIMRAERERNLGTQMNDIQAAGSNAAYQQAQQQFNTEQAARQAAAQLNAQQSQFGAGFGLQGLNTALQGANTLGTLGQNQYQQDMGINQLQNQYGLQQQNQVQKVLDTGYQDFQNYQNYPYKQLGFMSDMLRGLPLAGTQSKAMYEQGPSLLTQAAGVAGIAKGAGMFKEGGQVKPAGLSELALYHMRQG